MKEMNKVKGYHTGAGYKGYIPNKGYILFCTEDEYKEYYAEYFKE